MDAGEMIVTAHHSKTQHLGAAAALVLLCDCSAVTTTMCTKKVLREA
jgi:hypothetical protein